MVLVQAWLLISFEMNLNDFLNDIIKVQKNKTILDHRIVLQQFYINDCFPKLSRVV